MRLNIVVDIDIDESGLIEDEVKDDIVSFTRDLLINGACEQEIGFTLREVDYSIGETEAAGIEDAASISKPLTGPQSIASEVFNTIIREMPEGVSMSDVNEIFECIKDEMHEVKMKLIDPGKVLAEEKNILCSTEIKEKQDFSYNAWTGRKKVRRYGIELCEGERYFSLNLIEYLGDIVNVLIEGKTISVFSRDGKRIDTFTRKDSET